MKKIILMLLICQGLFAQNSEDNNFYSLVRSDTFYIFEPGTLYINEHFDFYSEIRSEYFSPNKPKLTYYSVEDFEITSDIDSLRTWFPVMKIDPSNIYDEKSVYYNKYTVLIKCHDWNRFSRWNSSEKKWTVFYDDNFLPKN